MSDLILKWYWRYHSLEVDEFEDVEAAALSAEWDVEEGWAALDHIEVVHSDGTSERLDPDAASAIATAYHAARAKTAPPPPKPTRKIVLTSERGMATLVWYSDDAAAEADYRRLAALLGDRVRLEPA